MRIGFDLDKVLIDFPPFVPDYLIDKLYKRRSNGVLEYRIPMKPEQFIRYLTHHPQFRRPIKENIAFLKSIATEENELYLISSRYGFLKTRTEALVKKHGLDKIFKRMYFNYQDKQAHLFKNEVLQDLHLEKYVDDDFALLKYLAKHNKKTMHYWLNHKTNGKLTRNLYGVKNIADIITKS